MEAKPLSEELKKITIVTRLCHKLSLKSLQDLECLANETYLIKN